MSSRRRRQLLGLALSASFAGASACGGDTGKTDPPLVESKLARNTAPVVATGDTAELVAGNTKFAFDLYHQVAAGDDTTNLFYSPYSISIALAMTYAGAAETTATEMATALDFTLPSAKLHPAFDALDLALASRATASSPSDGRPFQLRVVDSLWAEESLPFEAPFLDTLALDYGAGIRPADFIRAPDAARSRINSWVSTETENKIQNLLPHGSIDSTTRLVLVNAIYFNADWESKFERTATAPAAFHRLDGSTSNPDTMAQEGTMGFAKGTNYEAVELSYVGHQASMVFVVPDAGQFSAVEGKLAGDFVSSVFSALTTTEVTLAVPKFTVQGATISLKKELSALGMADAFTTAANFSGMTTADSLYLDDVLHQAFVKVDENGTEAAAATAVVSVDTLAILTTQAVTIDRPFFYIIRDIPTNTVLFVGREVDPK